MKRWNTKHNKNLKNEDIDDFLEDIVEVCKRHKLTISHEDAHGAFKIESFNKYNIAWIKNAFDSTEDSE